MAKIDELILKNKGLVFKQLHKFYLAKDPEAISIAYEALYNAIMTYKDNRNARFSTYASVCIYNALGTYVRSLNKVRQLDVVSYNAIKSLDENDVECLGILASDYNLEEEVIRTEQIRKINLALQQTKDALTNKTHLAIFNAWDETDFMGTITEIAKKVGVTQSYVSQILNKIRHMLRIKMEGER